MSRHTIEEINKIITELPEENLKQILKYLKIIEKESQLKSIDNELINKIFGEDDNLLHKLAK